MGRSKLEFSSLLALCALFLVGSASAADRSETIRVGGQVRSFSAHIPDGAPPSGGFPIVLAFHGGGMQGAGMQRITRLDAVADARRFIVLYPDGVNTHWNDGRSTIKDPQDDIGFVSAPLDQVERSYPVDRRRIFATGISNGALFAERLGCELSGRIAGIAPVAGSMPAETLATCRPARGVAVLQIDGTADPIMPYGGGAVKDFGGKGEGGIVSSVAQSVTFWAKNNGCGAAGARQPLPPVARMDRTRPEPGDVERLTTLLGRPLRSYRDYVAQIAG